jgi:hypothetical protein
VERQCREQERCDNDARVSRLFSPDGRTMASKRGRASSSSSGDSSAAWASCLPIDVLTEILSFLVDAPRGLLADCARPCAREHARAGRALAAVALTCTSWRAGVEESIIWRSLFYERWTVRHTTKALARALPLPAGEVRCLARDPRGPRVRARAPHVHAWASMYRARISADCAIRDATQAVARRARQLLTFTGTANRRGPRASTALVCDVCTCCAILKSVAAAKKHLRSHHGFGVNDDEDGGSSG